MNKKTKASKLLDIQKSQSIFDSIIQENFNRIVTISSVLQPENGIMPMTPNVHLVGDIKPEKIQSILVQPKPQKKKSKVLKSLKMNATLNKLKRACIEEIKRE